MCEATTCDQLFVEFLASLISLCISLAYSSICDIPVVYITLYIFIYSISSLCVSREMVYLQILPLHLPMDYVLWYCFLFMRFSDLKNKDLECIQYAFNLHVRLRWFNCCGNCICQCRPFFVLRALGLCGSSPKYVVFGLLVVIQSFLHLPSHHFHMREGPFFINFTSRRLKLATFAWFWKYSRAWRLDRLDND